MSTVQQSSQPLRNRFQVPPHMNPYIGEAIKSTECSVCHHENPIGAFDYHDVMYLPDGTVANITTADLIDYAQDCGWGYVDGQMICPACLAEKGAA